MDACFGLLILFSTILLLLYLRIPIWMIFIISAVFISLISNGFNGIYENFIYTINNSNTWDLVVIMYFIAIFVYLYKDTGAIKNLGRALMISIGRPSLVSMLVPAILGLLPIPGGA